MKTNPHMIEGIRFFKEGKFFHALEKFISALKQDENNPVIRGNLAQTYLKLGELNSAIREFEQVISIEKNDFDARYELGRIYFRLKNYYRAYIHFRYIAEYNPEMYREFEVVDYIEYIRIISEQMIGFENIGMESSTHLKAGRKLMDKKLYMFAMEELKQALDLDLDSAEVRSLYIQAAYSHFLSVTGEISISDLIEQFLEKNDFPQDISKKIDRLNGSIKDCILMIRKTPEQLNDPEIKRIFVDLLILDRKFSLAYDHIDSIAEYAQLKPRLQKILQK